MDTWSCLFEYVFWSFLGECKLQAGTLVKTPSRLRNGVLHGHLIQVFFGLLFYIVKSLCGVQVQVGKASLEVLGELVIEVGALAQLFSCAMGTELDSARWN